MRFIIKYIYIFIISLHTTQYIEVPKRIIDLIKNENIRKYMKTFSEIHSDFLVLEHRVFSLYGGKKSFNDLYINKENRSEELSNRAQQLVGLCLSLQEEPFIRYSANSRDAKTLAELFNQQFSDTKQSLSDWTPNQQNQSILLIMDRKDDPLTPFLHNLSFQPMIFDLLHDDIIENGTKIKGLSSSTDQKEQASKPDTKSIRSMPDENDQVWIKYRHEFIGEVVQQLPKQFNQWQTQNAVVKLKRNNNSDAKTKDLISAARDMPQYQKLVKQYTTNISMADKLMKIFKSGGLRDIIQLEQDMATGIDEDGKKIDRTKMQKQFSEILMNGDKDEILKLRTFMMYVISQGGMKPEQRKIMLKQSGFSESTEDIIVNLGCLGVTLTAQRPGQPSGGCKNYWKQVVKIAKSKVETTSITRYTSYLEWTLNEQFNNSLSDKDFEWIQKPGNQKKARTVKSYRKHAKNKGDNDDNGSGSGNKSGKGPRYIVFFLGGVSYSEIKTCYEFSKKNDVDIFVGSTLIYSPQQYLKCFEKGNNSQSNDEQKGDQ